MFPNQAQKTAIAISLISLGLVLLLVGSFAHTLVRAVAPEVLVTRYSIDLVEKVGALLTHFGLGIGLLGFIGLLIARDLPLLKMDRFTAAGISDASGSSGEKAFNLFLVSFLILFLELSFIRWLATEVNLLGYFKNLVLISCFLGMGVGCALASRKTHLLSFLPVLAGFLIYATLNLSTVRYINLYPWSGQEAMFGVLPTSELIHVISFYVVLVFFFLFNAVTFITLGQSMGKLMTAFSPLKAYTINIAGSLIGIWAFSVVCFLSFSPPVWFTLGIIPCLWFLRGNRPVLWAGAAISLTIVLALYSTSEKAIWSPYYKIKVSPLELSRGEETAEKVLWGSELKIINIYHQKAINLSPAFTAKYPELFPNPRYHAYNLPHRIKKAKNVLVVGAGTGNDVAAALRNGAERVVAVEIDPVILNLGQELHPENPYQSPKVELVNDDARSFFNKCSEKFDLIIYGLLDSHTLFSHMSSLRLENYVYTVESFREAKRLLTEDGVLALTLSIGQINKWMGDRLYTTLSRVFNKEPFYLDTHYDGGMMFLTGGGVSEAIFHRDPELQRILSERRISFDTSAVDTTDDWPFLYLQAKEIPRAYWVTLGLLFLVSVGMIAVTFPSTRRVNLHFFFLGSAFLLLETKNITELALLVGSTWIVNSIVFSGILIMILAANLYVSKRNVTSVRPYYVLLGLSLLLNYFMSYGHILGQSLIVRTIISCFIVSLPIFFAAIIFATSFSKTTMIDIAFASNLLGAIMGGFFEYGSMIYGIKSLCLFALALYALSYVVLPFQKS